MGWLNTVAGKTLEGKARIIQENYPRVIFSKSGIMYSMLKIDNETIRPFHAGDFEKEGDYHDFSRWRHKPDGEWDILTYENSITTSGLYLGSQAWRYRATGDVDALAQAEKAFYSLDMIYRMGVTDGRPGWMGKPYSGRLSDQTSPDQYLDACVGLYAYYPHAPASIQRRIEEMFVKFADYWKSIDYHLVYFGQD